VRGFDSGGGTLRNPDLYLYDDNGRFLTSNRNSGVGYDAKLQYTPSRDGDYFIAADGYIYSTGTYTISVSSGTMSGLSAVTGQDLLEEDINLGGLTAPQEAENDITQGQAFGPEPEDYAAQHALGRDWDLF
jgi:hypothetical protein